MDPPVTKWKVVPPPMVFGSRGWCVRTNVGAWYGGSCPHQPSHSSLQGPRTGPNMFRPMTNALAAVIALISERFVSA